MDKELIAKRESANDGKSIYLYYDRTVGVYFGFGLSAYYSTMITEPFFLCARAFSVVLVGD